MNVSSSTNPIKFNAIGSLLTASCLLTLVPGLGAQALEVTGGSLASIAGSPTLVTVVLQGGAKDANLQILELQGSLITFVTTNGEQITYQKSDIAQINVQGEMIEKRPSVVASSVALSAEDQQVVDSANLRVAELFQSSKDNQELRIWAAGYMAYNGNNEATEYLTSLATSNNIQTRLDAARGLYLAGKPLPEGLITEGMQSSNRNVRAEAAVLAGLFKTQSVSSELTTMLNDRSEQYAAPAAVALARIGDREIVPKLFEMMGSNSEKKNHAAILALTILGGDDVIEQLKYTIEQTDGLERYRLITVLFKLGAPEGRKHLIRVFNEELTIKPDAALLLAADGYWDAIQYLQGRLKRREDPTLSNQIYRARNAHAILQSGDPSAIYVFQSMLREEEEYVKGFALDLLADLADRSLLKIVQPSIRNIDPGVSLKACNASLAIASPGFRENLQDVQGKP